MSRLSAGKLVTIRADAAHLEGILEVPPGATGIVLFSHGSGSKSSRRNTFRAGVLNQAGLGTLQMDLLTEDEDRDYARRFDIDLLSQRLAQTVSWLCKIIRDARVGDRLVWSGHRSGVGTSSSRREQ